MELTKEQAISEHRKMWNWIADKIEKEKECQEIGDLKEEYCIENDFLLKNDCFCCEYTKNNCDNCPIEWKSVLKEFMCEQKHKEDDDEGFMLNAVKQKIGKSNQN